MTAVAPHRSSRVAVIQLTFLPTSETRRCLIAANSDRGSSICEDAGKQAPPADSG